MQCSIDRQRHKLFTNGFDLMRRKFRQPIGEADHQRKVRQPIDLSRAAVAQIVHRFDRVARKDIARRPGGFQAVLNVLRGFFRRERSQERRAERGVRRGRTRPRPRMDADNGPLPHSPTGDCVKDSKRGGVPQLSRLPSRRGGGTVAPP